jgi:hypothetical protein
MKIRTGFVSNSSSSSFIIGSKEEPTVEKVRAAFKISVDSPIIDELDGIVKGFVENMDGDWLEGDEILEYAGCSSVEELRDKISKSDAKWYKDYYNAVLEIYNRGWTLFEGSAGDDGDDYGQIFVCQMYVNIINDDIIIYKDGGY